VRALNEDTSGYGPRPSNHRKSNPKEGVYHRKNPTRTGPSDERISGNTVSAAVMGLMMKEKQAVQQFSV
jgi:hypothetical protein